MSEMRNGRKAHLIVLDINTATCGCRADSFQQIHDDDHETEEIVYRDGFFHVTDKYKGRTSYNARYVRRVDWFGEDS